MIDWIVGWMHLLYLDYILNIMNEVVFIIIFAFLYVHITYPFLNNITEWFHNKTLRFIDVTKSHVDYGFIIFCVYLIFTSMIFYTTTNFNLNKTEFYIKNNGVYSNIISECVKNNETRLKDCVEDKFSNIRNEKRLYVKEQFIKLIKQYKENGAQND